MRKRVLALTLSLVVLLTMAIPLEASAKPPWWNRFKDIVVADAVGALEGFIQTETGAGAIVGGIVGSLKEGLDQGISGGGWAPDEEAAESVGLHHNLGLNFYFDQGAPENINRVLLEYLAQQRIPADQRQMEAYLSGLDPSLEELLRRIREGTTGPFNPNPGAADDGHGEGTGHGVIVSANFVSNLQRTLAILDGDADHPQQMLDEAAVFFLNASLREMDDDFREDIVMKAQDYNSSRSNKRGGVAVLGDDGGSLSFDKIKTTYEQQKTNGQPADMILAWIFVDVLQHSSLYWSDVYCWSTDIGSGRAQADDNGSLWCWGANFERVMVNPDADTDTSDVFMVMGDYRDVDDDGDTIPDTIDPVIEDEEADEVPPVATERYELVLTIDGTTARSGSQVKGLDAAPFIKDGRTLVPFRFIGEELGAEIGWIPASRTVTYQRGAGEDAVMIEMIIGQSTATINGASVPIDRNPTVTPEIVNGRTVVPVRFISEALGFEVDWNPDRREVTISAEVDT
ncbi:copper amine oxidase N-terminal domain-containing protein [Anoxynatronum sibiricum]|uniref:Copper amine oxidase N-terminal domain-containing protein n=1 Tax=Anoxynatronum sibiricum TaxID=210623 RepID=A0ABU9VY61_9CLOT